MPAATTERHELARLEQALEDLAASGATSVSLVHCASSASEASLVVALTEHARALGFVTAKVPLRKQGLESPDALVRAILAALRGPAETTGLLALLELYYDEYGTDSAARFAEAARARGANGDLTALCHAYLSSDEPDAVAEKRAYKAWCEGVEPPRKYRNQAVRRALSERTAQRALSELTRIVCALEHRGTFVMLSEGDALARRTQRQREKGYTVLRELVDNFDGAGGAIATRVVLSGRDALFHGPHSLRELAPLRMRLEIPSAAAPPPPHRSWTTLVDDVEPMRHRPVTAPVAKQLTALRDLIRISEGLPPLKSVTGMTVGQERLDRTVKRLFELVSRAGRFFSVLVGDYGSGKTHLMMHLAERALEDSRPVFWLNLERTNLDLGNPARHLSRFLDHSQLPLPGRPTALSLVSRWTRSTGIATLRSSMVELAAGAGEAAIAARKALRIADRARDPGFALEGYLSGFDLDQRPGDATYRRDAYRRIFLWFELLARLEGIRGPLILIDEAENLYTSGRPPASRRTSLRSLAFYCGGALPSTCVILAMTPPAFEELKGEARDLLAEAKEMESTLALEDVDRFRRSLWGLKPDPVKPLSKVEREELCERVRKLHRGARGMIAFAGWNEHVRHAAAASVAPRVLIRSVIDELESAWWAAHP